MPVPARQLAMLRCRYDLASAHAQRHDVLELGCGSGIGLEFLRPVTQHLIGADFSEDNLREAREHVPLVPVVAVDAHSLPFAPSSFDVVLLLEMIYYLADPTIALAASRSVLRPGGTIVVCLPNPEGAAFHPSPFSHTYPSAGELAAWLTVAGFDAQIFGGFPTGQTSVLGRLVALGTSAVSKLGVMPRTLRGRARLKRLVHGKLRPLGQLNGETVNYPPLEEIEPNSSRTKEFTNLYAVGHRR